MYIYKGTFRKEQSHNCLPYLQSFSERFTHNFLKEKNLCFNQGKAQFDQSSFIVNTPASADSGYCGWNPGSSTYKL